MPYKIDRITDCLISFDGGETFKPLSVLPESVNISAEAEESNNHRDVYKQKECSMTGSFEVDHADWMQLMDQVNDNPARYDLHYTYKVQNRRHKKKRINKKWAKRYGYRLEEEVIKGIEFYDEQIRCM